MRTPLLLLVASCALPLAPTAEAKRPKLPPGLPLPEADSDCFAEVSSKLATDDMEGRGLGTAGNAKAAALIAQWMDGMGLAAPPTGRTQPFEARIGVTLGDKNLLDGAAPGAGWTPLGISKSGNFKGDVVFAGYGIRAKELGYDDYDGLDVKGKVVLAMRFEPGEDVEASPFDGKRPTRYSDLRTKAIVAREAGATALFLVSPAKAPDEPDSLPPLRTMGPQSDAGIPVLQISRATAERWLGGSLAAAQATIDAGYKPASRGLPGITTAGQVDLRPVTAPTQNVVGVRPGQGALAEQIVVLGAHYDHLGHGGAGSFQPDVAAIHNGADDNASGVAGILCAAKRLTKATPDRADRRTVVVVAFSAEEIGLGGSGLYVQKPLVGTMATTAAMVNLDMVGRLRDQKLSVLGTDSAPGWAGLLATAGLAVPSLVVNSGGDGYGPSDQSSFYAEGVPVAHLFTGAHEQYHTPEDDAALLNNVGGGEIVAFTEALVTAATRGDRLTYVRTAAAPMSGDSRGYGAYFGSVPDYSTMEAKTGGVKLSDVRKGSPAEKAGLQKGDVITGMAGTSVQNLYDMTFVLREHRAGETIEVVFQRGGVEQKKKATLATRSGDGKSPHKPAPPPHASFSIGAEPVAAKGWAPAAGKATPELMRPDEPHLTDLRRLTFGGENAEAYWAPDGKRLIFQRTGPEGGCDAEYVLDLDTGTVTLASSGKGRTTCGYFDYPAGNSVLYATTDASGPSCPPTPDHSAGYVWALYDTLDIVRDDLKGGVTPWLAAPGYDAEATTCFKDGRVIFTSTRGGDLDLWSANADGSALKQLTNTPGYDGGAFFTPDCKRIVWRASRPIGDALTEYQNLLAKGLVRPSELEIFVMNADGTKVAPVTKAGGANFAPYPTPDGKGVLYSSNAGDNPREFDVHYASWDGKKAERITAAPGFDGFPMFSPDGKWLVFSSNRANAEGARDTDVYIARWVR